MSSEANAFQNVANSDGRVSLANDSTVNVTGRGSISIKIDANGSQKIVNLNDTLLVPNLRTNLLSVGRICDHGMKVIFEQSQATIVEQDGRTVLKAARTNNGLYFIHAETSESSGIGANANWSHGTRTDRSAAELWHRKMGHLNYRDLERCCKENLVSGINIEGCREYTRCEICARGKMTRNPFPSKSERKTEFLEIIHSDVCGPMRNDSEGGSTS